MVFEQEQSDTINVKYSKLDGVLSFFKNIVGYKVFIYTVILAVSSMVSIFGYHPIPFVMLAVATVFKIPLLLPGVVTVLSMIILKASVPEIMLYVLTNITYIIATVVINIQDVGRKVAIGIKLAISMAIVTVIMFFVKNFELGYLLDNIALIFLVQAIYYLYVHGFYFLSNIDKNMIYSVEEIVSMAVMVMITLLPITNAGNVGMNIWMTICLLFVVLIGYTGNAISGIAVSVVLGMFSAILSKDINVLAVVVAPGIVASLLNRVNKAFSIIGVVISAVILNYIMQRNLVISPEIIETAIASLVILILPKKVMVILEDIFDKNNTLRSAYEKELGVGSDIKNKLSAMSEVFDNLSSITLNSNKEYFEETQKVIEKYLNDYKESKCLSCNKRYYCLKDNMNLVSSYIARKLEGNDEITESMLPVDCEEATVMIKEIKDIYNNMKLMRIIKQKEEESNIKLANEYKEVATLIKNMSRDVSKLKKEVSYTQKCIRQELKLLGYQIYEDNYIDEKDNKIYEFITDILDDVDKAKGEIQTVVGEVIGQKMNIKLILNSSKNEKSRIKLVSDGKYAISTEIYQKSKNEGEKNGDTYYVSDIKNGKVIAISDGMGSGNNANQTSSAVISMVEKLLESGFGNSTITKVVNGMVKLKEDASNAATLDMTVINTNKEKIEFVKAGAAPTYVISNFELQEIGEDTLPLGQNIYIDYDSKSLEIKSPMIIVNISDGAYSDELREYFEYISKKNFAFITKKEIISGIIERIRENRSDDVTIIVTKIE